MAIYMDAPTRNEGLGLPCFHGRECSQLMADTEAELRAYATEIGLPIRWIQDPGRPSFHFDLTGHWLAYCRNDPRVKKLDELATRLLTRIGQPLANDAPESGFLDFDSEGGP